MPSTPPVKASWGKEKCLDILQRECLFSPPRTRLHLYSLSLRLPAPKTVEGQGAGAGARARPTTHAPPRTRSPSALALLPSPARRGRGCRRPRRVRRPRHGGGARERLAGRGLLVAALLRRGPLAQPPSASRLPARQGRATNAQNTGPGAVGAALPPPPPPPPS
jgi:hypothetical protein